MIAYDESKRCKVLNNYTGCPCRINLSSSYSINTPIFNRNKFFRDVEDLIKLWKHSCHKYEAGPTVGNRINENWNRAIKLPYGIFANITCVFNESGPDCVHYCKHSLKQIDDPLEDYSKVLSKIEGTVELADDKIYVHSICDHDIACIYQMPEDAILKVKDGDKVKQFDVLYLTTIYGGIYGGVG